MTQSRQSRRAQPQQPSGNQHRVLRLSDLPDTLTVAQFCAVFQWSERHFRAVRAHGALPVEPLDVPGDLRFSNSAVAAFLAVKPRLSLRRSA